MLPSGAPCRAATGPCDLPASCTGASPTCPANGLRDTSVVCRAASQPCDAAERCDGVVATCPQDAASPDGSACDDGLVCTSSSACQAGTCAPSFVLELVGVIAGTVGIAVVFTGILTFRRARTAVYPNRPASRIVQHGIYARTRNPMYVGLTLLYVGMTLAFVSTGAVLLLPLVLLALRRYVIAREERYLQAAFPDEYAAYCARVGRWW